MINRITKIIENVFPPLDLPREYIGASSIGVSCERAIWYAYQGAERLPMEPKRRRTLDIGKTLEALIINSMLHAGLDIILPNKDNAFLAVSDKKVFHFQGHMDAIWRNNGIIEIKTAKDSSFKIFVKHGLLKWYPVYYAQIQSYMGMSGIHSGYVLAINKDTSELHDEYVEFNSVYYERLVEKAAKIIAMDTEPGRVSNSPLYFQCRLCDYKVVCHR